MAQERGGERPQPEAQRRRGEPDDETAGAAAAAREGRHGDRREAQREHGEEDGERLPLHGSGAG